MMRDSDPRFPARTRPFQSFRVSKIERIEDSGEAAVHHEPTAQREKQRRQDQGQRDD